MTSSFYAELLQSCAGLRYFGVVRMALDVIAPLLGFESAIVTVGRIRNCRLRYQGWPGLPTPDGGSHWSVTAKTRISREPVTNSGNETAASDETEIV